MGCSQNSETPTDGASPSRKVHKTVENMQVSKRVLHSATKAAHARRALQTPWLVTNMD